MIRQCPNATHLHPCRRDHSLTAMSLCSDLRGAASHFDAQPPHCNDDQDIQSVHGRHTQVIEMPSLENDLFFSCTPHAKLAYTHICSAEVECAHLLVQWIIHAHHFLFCCIVGMRRMLLCCVSLCWLVQSTHTRASHTGYTRVSSIGAVAHPYHGFLCIRPS